MKDNSKPAFPSSTLRIDVEGSNKLDLKDGMTLHERRRRVNNGQYLRENNQRSGPACCGQ